MHATHGCFAMKSRTSDTRNSCSRIGSTEVAGEAPIATSAALLSAHSHSRETTKADIENKGEDFQRKEDGDASGHVIAGKICESFIP